MKYQGLRKRTLVAAMGMLPLGILTPGHESARAGWTSDAISLKRASKVVSKEGLSRDVDFHSLKHDDTAGLGLVQSGELSHRGAVERYLREAINNPSIMIKQKDVTIDRIFYLNGRSPTHETSEFNFTLNGIDLCGFPVRSHRLHNGSVLTLGKTPVIPGDGTPAPLEKWPEAQKAFDHVRNHMQAAGIETEEAKILGKKKCYFLKADGLHPVWNFRIHSGGMGFRAISGEDEVAEFETLAFDVTGRVTVYEKNPADATLKTYEVELSGDQKLTNDFFTTKYPTNSEKSRAEEDDHVFEYDASDDRFAEASVFGHANIMYQYFRELGYTWAGTKPLDLYIGAKIGGTVNNALYQPAESLESGFPRISIGTGDGRLLQNLLLDADVVGHEFGHHVVFKTLKTTSGESLVLHEGLADFFAFARTNDSCLGESICPAGSSACTKEAQCLRSADNVINYKESNYSDLQPHRQGQIVSGFLWDLHEDKEMALEDVTKLMFNGIGLFVTNSGLKDFILSVLFSDQSLNEGKNCQAIYDAAESRGFSEFLADVDCTKPQDTWGKIIGTTPVVEKDGDEPVPPITTPRKKKKSEWWECGVVGSGLGWSSSAVVLFLLFFPLAPILFRARHRQGP